MATRLVLAVGLITALVPVRAGAETLATASGKGDLKETRHEVRVRFQSSFAELTVTRSIKYMGTETDELAATLDLPPRASASSFKSRYGHGAWRNGSFLSASQASKTYEYLTHGAKQSGKLPSDGVILLRADEKSLGLDAYPLTPGLEIAVQYQVTVPLCYSKGIHYFHYPKSAKLTVAPSPGRIAWTAKKGFGAKQSGCRGAQLGKGVMVASQLTESRGPIRAEMSALRLQSSGRTVVRVRAESANQLAAFPHQAKTVFIVDASHSVSDVALAKQVQLMRAYIDKMPRGHFELVLTQRRAKRLFGRFVSSSEIQARLSKPLPRSNGSFLEQSVALAAHMLRGQGGAHRVVAFTDGLRGLRQTVAPVLASGKGFSDQTVLHLVSLNSSRSWVRDDKHELFDLAKPTGGIALSLGEKLSRTDTKALAMHLISPQYVHELELKFGGTEGISEPEFAAGKYTEHFAATEERVAQASLTGQLWSTPFTQTIKASPIVAKALPALAIGEDFATDPELKELALLARAVTRFTSYLVKPRGMSQIYRAPEEGGGGIGIGGFGTSSCGCCMGVRSRIGASLGLPKDVRVNALRALISPKLQACGAAARGGVSLRIDTTRDEIVDVSVLGADNSELAGCAVEASWSARIPADLFTEDQAAFAVPLSR